MKNTRTTDDNQSPRFTNISNDTDITSLAEEHRRELEAVLRERLGDYWLKHLRDDSAIPLEVIEERGYREARSAEDLKALGFSGRGVGALIIPWHSPDGTTVIHQIKLRNPGRHKYLFPTGQDPVLHVRPSRRVWLDDVSVPLWITEGPKQTDAFPGAVIVGMGGVYNFAKGGSGSKKMLPCWDHISLDGREVYVAFDSDVTVKPAVQLALSRLVARLEERAAHALVVHIPDPDKKGMGLDDYFAAGGTLTELEMSARPFEPANVIKERVERDPQLNYRMMRFSWHFRAQSWRGHGGATARDVYLSLMYDAGTVGKVTKDGVKIRPSLRRLAEMARVSDTNTVSRSLRRLVDFGLIRVDRRGVKPRESAFIVVLTNRVKDPVSMGDERLSSLPYPSLIDRTFHRPATVRNGYVKRTGPNRATEGITEYEYCDPGISKRGTELLMRLDESRDGRLSGADLAFALEYQRTVDLTRKGGLLDRLSSLGLLSVEDGEVILAKDWRLLAARVRFLSGEDKRDESQSRRFALQRQQYAIRRLSWKGLTPEEIAAKVHLPVETVCEFLRKPDPEPDLKGPEHMAPTVAERLAEDDARDVEEQRRKVGTTAATFLADEMEGALGFAYRELSERWLERGGTRKGLAAAAGIGPYHFHREGDGRWYLYKRLSDSEASEQATKVTRIGRVKAKAEDEEAPDPEGKEAA